MPKIRNNFINISECIDYFDRYDNLKLLFPNIIKLIRILICKPVSSVTCESSFSGLRRLKTWLSNSMSNERLNNLLLCHVHKELLNEVDDDSVILRICVNLL